MAGLNHREALDEALMDIVFPVTMLAGLFYSVVGVLHWNYIPQLGGGVVGPLEVTTGLGLVAFAVSTRSRKGATTANHWLA